MVSCGLVLRLHVEGGLSVADVVRALGEDQKALYRRRDALFKQLRRDLEAEGIWCADAHELLSTLDWELAATRESAAAGTAGTDDQVLAAVGTSKQKLPERKPAERQGCAEVGRYRAPGTCGVS
jgi:hypothetical protein